MNSSEFDETKLLWKMFYAGECFRQARAAAQHILDGKLEREAPLFYPLITAVYVLYAKPFTRADGVGKLDNKIVPQEYEATHKMLLDHRHQVYAHRDADGFEVADYGPVNQVRAIRLQQEIRLFCTDFHSRFPAMPSIITLCQKLEEKNIYYVDKLWNKYGQLVPNKVGEYMLNVQDANGDIWIAQKPMILKQPT